MSNGPTTGQTNEADNLARQAKDAETMRENLLIALDNQIKLNELEKEKAAVLGQQLTVAQKQLDINTAIVRQTSDTLDTMIKQAKTLEGAAMTAEQFRDVLDKMNKHTIEGEDAQKRYKAILEDIRKTQNMSDEDRIKALKQAKKEMEELRANMEDVKNFGDKFNNNLSSFGRNFGIASDLSSTMSGNIASMAADFSRGFSMDKLMMITKSFQQFGITILASIVDKIASLAIELDKLSKEFERANGLGMQFEETIAAADAALINAGLSAKETTDAVQALLDNFSSLDRAAEEQNTEITKVVGSLSRLGISTQTSTKSIEILSKTFNKTGLEAALMFAMIARSGNDASITNKKMAADFEANFSSLVQFGDRAVEVFKGLAAQSKATGVEMGSLINIAKKFDTFEGAAKSAQQLNAVLGVNMSMMDLLYADYDETIELIQQGLSGVDFANLNRFEKNIIANAIGAKDAYEAQRILNGEAEEYEKKMKMQAQTQEQLLKLAAENIPLFERLALGLEKIARAAEFLLTPLMVLNDILIATDNIAGGLLVPFGMIGTSIMGLVAYAVSGTVGFKILFQVMKEFASKGIMTQMFVGFKTIASNLTNLARASVGVRAAMAGVFGLFAIGYNMLSDFVAGMFPFFKSIQFFVDVLAYVAMGFAAFSAGLVGAIPAAIFVSLGLLFRYFDDIVNLFKKTFNWFRGANINPNFVNIFSHMALGALDFAVGLLGLEGPFRVVISMFKKAFIAATPLVGAMAKLVSYLPGVGSPDSPSVSPDAPKNTSIKPTEAIQAAAAEVKTLVVAQLKDTGIQATADELGRIAKAMEEREQITNVSVNLDGKPLEDFIFRTITS